MISIITPVLNGAKYIQTNIESIAKLEVEHEHIIVDGGSTDATLDIIKKYPHLKVFRQGEKPGMYGAIHQGIENSSYEYITWINADDYVLPKGYTKMIKEMSIHQVDFVYSNSVFHYIEKFYYKKVFAKHFARHLLKEGVFSIIQPSSIFTKKGYVKVGGFKYNELRLIADRDLFQRMAYDGALKFKYVNVFSTVFLRYSGSLLYRNLDKLKAERTYTIKTNLGVLNRLIFHTSQMVRRFESLFSNSKLN